jgi:epoxide hydrolase-like predicted phosphatase
MMTLLRQLRSAGYQLALLTNIYAERREWLRRRFPPDLIDVYGDSSELGLRKPDPRIYVEVLELMGRQASEVVFIDDFTENIEPARTLGMTTILFQDPPQVEKALRALGIEALGAAR